MDQVFKDPMEKQTYTIKLTVSKQGNLRFNDYHIHYRNLAARAGVDIDSMVVQFTRSLDPRTTRGWQPTTIPITFNEVVQSIQNHIQVSNWTQPNTY